MTWLEEFYKQFSEWSPEYSAMVTNYKPWGRHSIVIWLNNNMAFKVRRVTPNKFIMQMLSEEDIKKKYKD